MGADMLKMIPGFERKEKYITWIKRVLVHAALDTERISRVVKLPLSGINHLSTMNTIIAIVLNPFDQPSKSKSLAARFVFNNQALQMFGLKLNKYE